MSALAVTMPAGTFDADDLVDAAETVASAGERLDVGLVLGAASATVDPAWLISAVGRWRGRVVMDLPDGGCLTVSANGRSHVAGVQR